jgi:hypothetical protein
MKCREPCCSRRMHRTIPGLWYRCFCGLSTPRRCLRPLSSIAAAPVRLTSGLASGAGVCACVRAMGMPPRARRCARRGAPSSDPSDPIRRARRRRRRRAAAGGRRRRRAGRPPSLASHSGAARARARRAARTYDTLASHHRARARARGGGAAEPRQGARLRLVGRVRCDAAAAVELRLGPSDRSCTLSCIRESKHRGQSCMSDRD